MTGDGFGDQLSEGELVERYERWAHKVANARRPAYDPVHDDLVQEALTEIWLTLKAKGPGTSPRYLTASAKGRMDDVLRGRPQYGNPAAGGQTYRPKTVSADAVEDGAPDVWSGLTAVDALAGVELAYHRGELLEAVCGLAPELREYVWLRFWGGLRDSEIAERLGVDRRLPGQWWVRRVRPRLAERLSHLVSV